MRTLIRGVRVFDGLRTIPCADVLIDGAHIADPGSVESGSGPGFDGPGPGPELGAGAGADPGAGAGSGSDIEVEVEVDGTGRTLLPGLIDAHTHVFDGSLAQALRFGVTTELDMFCLPSNLARQRALAAERDDVADLRSAGVLATPPGGHPSGVMAAVAPMLANPEDAAGPFATISGPEEAEEFVAARVAEGSDYLKFVVDDGAMTGAPVPVLDPDTAAALVNAARTAGLRTLAHVATARDTVAALDAGADGIAHVWSDTAPGDPYTEALVTRIALQGTFVVSTLAYVEAVSGDRPERLAHALYVAGALHRAGVPLLAGTDATPFTPQHGEGLHRELELLVLAGLTPAEALTAATSLPARHFALDDRGRIAPGLRADLLLVEGDPTRHIHATRALVGVWRRGTHRPG
ncbi:amidohydrolase family protein [Streptomyces iconiensis]|uniref:Amidohydrolase family protein n=1 Tax=Streptomyces iconiensis TaxID=1384038 RepID=A0ABT6ZR19_9ACTN|nr:amidohydrolase family protein [Streptomyces iconiensis]MDJ1131498.1 amidohydrolase family protein [Streptomyces iconiensis]